MLNEISYIETRQVQHDLLNFEDSYAVNKIADFHSVLCMCHITSGHNFTRELSSIPNEESLYAVNCFSLAIFRIFVFNF